MDLNRLNEFARIAEKRSLSAAAEELGVSSATLSARMKSFERSLGTPLLERAGSEMRLTDAGRCLLANAGEILQKSDLLVRNIASLHEHRYRSLRIVIEHQGFPLHLGPFLDRVNLTSPDFRLVLSDGQGRSRRETLLDGAADLWFTCTMDAAPDAELRCRTLARPVNFALMPIGHPLAKRTSVRLAELANECFVLSDGAAEPETRHFQLENLRSSGIPCTTYDSGTSSQFIRFLVPVGKGILLTPYPIADIPNSIQVAVDGLPRPAASRVYWAAERVSEDARYFLRGLFAFAGASVGELPCWKEEPLP